ncbi:hypothetical protein MED297_08886 [Reinekea sp. MED297]|uniref:Uncharacterized protein n=1 Tax=Reinekea blandensis MED297 TaxID=314283 RepID=A4BGG1_9GAMM|nr:hypothetical protein MED297_08886 [Reinekea sp. MED297] [Reinekea blandensis MED297]
MKCNNCNNKLKRKIRFWINPADAVGGSIVFGIIFLIFFLIVSFVIENTRVSLVPAFHAAEIGANNWFDFIGEALDAVLSVGLFLYLIFWGGAKFSKYFSYLFEFKFSIHKSCSVCGEKTVVVDLPEHPES